MTTPGNLTEAKLWQQMRTGMGRTWDASRHEDGLGVGVPDVSYGLHGVNGWIELKVRDFWPKRQNGCLRLDKLTAVQVLWLEKRGKSAGNCWVFMRIENTYLLFNWKVVRGLREKPMTPNQFKSYADHWWEDTVDWGEFALALTQGE